MKSSYLVLILSFFVVFSSVNVNSASYFNKNDDSSLYFQVDHLNIRQMKADRSMGELDHEDYWKLWYSFDVEVTNVVIYWEALDGTNDNDARTYTDNMGLRLAGQAYSKEHRNFPTYVDNMLVRVSYVYAGNTYTHNLLFFTQTPDQGSAPLFVALQPSGVSASDTITANNGTIDKDKGGVWDDGVFTDPLEAVVNMVKAPYNFIKFATDDNTIISLIISVVIIYVSTVLLIKFNSAGGEVGAGILLLLGIIMFVGIIIDGVKAVFG